MRIQGKFSILGCPLTLDSQDWLRHRTSWMNLLHNISAFLNLSARGEFGSKSVQQCYQKIEEVLKLLKPVANLLVTSIVSDDQLCEVLQQLVRSIKECSILFENFHPLASRIYLVIQAETLVTRIQTSILMIVQLLKDLPSLISSELNPKYLEHCFENLKNIIGTDSTSTFISEVMKVQASNQGPQGLVEIAGYLGLRSNWDILFEAVALEELKDNAELAGNDAKKGYFEQIITLLTRMHDCLFNLEQSIIRVPDFICPLSLEIMRDPVILSSGQTYERAYIKQWLDLGLSVCPKTRQTLTHHRLIPNYTCKAFVANYCEINDMKLPDLMESVDGRSIFLPCRGISIMDVDAEVKLAELIKFVNGHSSCLSIHDVDIGAKVKKLVENLKIKPQESLREATDQLRVFVKENTGNRSLFTYFGGIRLMVNLLYSSDPMIQENAVKSLLHLAIDNDNKVAIVEEDAIEPLIYVLQTGTPEAQESSAGAFFSLSMIENHKRRIGGSGAIVHLVELLSNGTPQGKNNAVIALFNLSICHENRSRIVEAGAVKFLVDFIKYPVAALADKAVFVLRNLATIPDGRKAISESGGIPILVEVVELGSAKGKESAASALLRLCTCSNRYCGMVLQEGAIPPLVALSQSGTPKAKEKALSLLSYFGRMRN